MHPARLCLAFSRTRMSHGIPRGGFFREANAGTAGYRPSTSTERPANTTVNTHPTRPTTKHGHGRSPYAIERRSLVPAYSCLSRASQRPHRSTVGGQSLVSSPQEDARALQLLRPETTVAGFRVSPHNDEATRLAPAALAAIARTVAPHSYRVASTPDVSSSQSVAQRHRREVTIHEQTLGGLGTEVEEDTVTLVGAEAAPRRKTGTTTSCRTPSMTAGGGSGRSGGGGGGGTMWATQLLYPSAQGGYVGQGGGGGSGGGGLNSNGNGMRPRSAAVGGGGPLTQPSLEQSVYGLMRLPKLDHAFCVGAGPPTAWHGGESCEGGAGVAGVNSSSSGSSSSNSSSTVGIACVKGRRVYMEDEYSVIDDLESACPAEHHHPHIKTSFWAVFDGHAGGRCSKVLSQTLGPIIAKDPDFHVDLKTAIHRGFTKANTEFIKQVAERLQINDGSTAITVFARGGRLYVANVGDSRAVLCARGKAVPLSVDQKPNRPEEKRRLAALGGKVVNCFGVFRVNGVLAVARAFGNRSMKAIIRPDPEIHERELVDGDDFLILGSDGLWDTMSNQEVVDIITRCCGKMGLQSTAELLVSTSIRKGSMDNTTAMVVDIRGLQRASAAEADVELQKFTHGSQAIVAAPGYPAPTGAGTVARPSTHGSQDYKSLALAMAFKGMDDMRGVLARSPVRLTSGGTGGASGMRQRAASDPCRPQTMHRLQAGL